LPQRNEGIKGYLRKDRHHFPQVPSALQVFLLKRPPQRVPTGFFLPGEHTSWRVPLVLVHLDLVMHLLALGPQGSPTTREVQKEVQHTVFGSLVPASHDSPASTTPFPHTAGDTEKSIGGG